MANYTIQFPGGSAAEIAGKKLAVREFCYDETNNRIYVGDGINEIPNLQYMASLDALVGEALEDYLDAQFPVAVEAEMAAQLADPESAASGLLEEAAATTATAAAQAAVTAALTGKLDKGVLGIDPTDPAYGVVAGVVTAAQRTANSTCLQNAVNVAAAKGIPVDLGGATVYLDTLTLPAGASIRNGSLVSSYVTTGDGGVITVTGNGALLSGVNLDAGPSAKFGVMVDAAVSGLTIDGGTFTGATSHAIALQDKATDAAVRNALITGVVSGIRVRAGVKRVKVENCHITDWSTYGIEVRGLAGVAPEDVQIVACSGDSPRAGLGKPRQFIATFGVDTLTRNLTITRCRATAPGGYHDDASATSTATGDFYGVQYVDGLTFTDNVSIGSGENGASLSRNIFNARVSGNYVSGADGHGLQVGQAGNPGATAVIVGNITINNGRRTDGANAEMAGLFIQGMSDVVISNNISTDTQTTKTQGYGLMCATVTGLTGTGNRFGGNKVARTQLNATTPGAWADGPALTVGDGTEAAAVTINGPAGARRSVILQTSGSSRWRIITDSAQETGSNAGSNLVIERYPDNGSVPLPATLKIERSTGYVQIGAVWMRDGGGKLQQSSDKTTWVDL